MKILCSFGVLSGLFLEEVFWVLSAACWGVRGLFVPLSSVGTAGEEVPLSSVGTCGLVVPLSSVGICGPVVLLSSVKTVRAHIYRDVGWGGGLIQNRIANLLKFCPPLVISLLSLDLHVHKQYFGFIHAHPFSGYALM